MKLGQNKLRHSFSFTKFTLFFIFFLFRALFLLHIHTLPFCSLSFSSGLLLWFSCPTTLVQLSSVVGILFHLLLKFSPPSSLPTFVTFATLFKVLDLWIGDQKVIQFSIHFFIKWNIHVVWFVLGDPCYLARADPCMSQSQFLAHT